MTNRSSFETLSKARELGRNALNSLPDTPVVAAGFNVRFKTMGECDEIEHLVAGTQLDGCLSESGYEIVGRLLSRKIRCRNTDFEKGTISLSLSVQEATAKIQLNLQRDSREVKDLAAWLSASTKDVEKAVDTILRSCGHISYQEKEHV